MEFTVNVNINAPGLVETIQALTSLLSGPKFNMVETAAAFAPVLPEQSAGKQNKSPEKPKEVRVEPEKLTPAVSVTTPATEPVPAPTSGTAPAVTLEVVRAKLASLSQAGKQAQVKELITKFGATKLSDIPAEKYAELLEAAEASA